VQKTLLLARGHDSTVNTEVSK